VSTMTHWRSRSSNEIAKIAEIAKHCRNWKQAVNLDLETWHCLVSGR
jgi:hypothetical protein